MAIEHADIEIVAACRNPANLLPNYKGEVRVGDLRDPDYLDRVLVGIDIICHAAGWSSYAHKPKASEQLYLEPTLDLIKHAIEWRIPRFVNLSSIAVMQPRHRQDETATGQPRRFWPMMNCMTAVEDYMQAHASVGCSFINLRAGIYSGERLKFGLLPLLLSRANASLLTYIQGDLGYLPLIDGQDIGQAFARAALAPETAQYESINVLGPDCPSQAEVFTFLHHQLELKGFKFGLPSSIAKPYFKILGLLKHDARQALITQSLADSLQNPFLSNVKSTQLLGFDPQVSWQASLLKFINYYKNQKDSLDLHQQSKPLDII